MCGIVGIINKNQNVVSKAINCLQQLEYRGYDSAGITIIKNQDFNTTKSVGKINKLNKKIAIDFSSNIAIAHTRWATHGEVNEANAHPHISCKNDIALVHNGIIENYLELKNRLINYGYTFKSETDSEVISNLIAFNLEQSNDIFAAFVKTLNELKGSYALAMIYNKEPNKIFTAKNNSPLIIGIGENENLIASSLTAFSKITNKIIQLKDKQIAILTYNNIELFDLHGKNINIDNIETVKINDLTVDKGNFEHFMLKEIYEQPDVLERTIQEYIDIENKKIVFPNINFDLSKIDFLTIVACGTSYYSGCIAKYLIEELAGIFVNVDIASEFRYRSNPLKNNGLAVFISQSGETADTLAALKYCKTRNQKILSIVNVVQSAMANESDIILKTMAGAEIGVASTKAFTAQVAILYLLALEIAKRKNKITDIEYKTKIESFINSTDIMKKSLNEDSVKEIENISKEIVTNNSLMYIGRDIFYPLALEGSLKMRELSYMSTLGIPSGELKHGSIALIDENSFTIILNNSNLLFDKSLSSIEEIAARKGKIILICDDKKEKDFKNKIYKFIKTPITNNKFEALLSLIIPIQLLAYFTAKHKGVDVDKPRNLAKSVTVE